MKWLNASTVLRECKLEYEAIRPKNFDDIFFLTQMYCPGAHMEWILI